MLFFYRLAINLVVLFSPIIILIRLLKKKEDPIRFKEKFGFYSKDRKKGKLIWFHGASVGEILSIIPLLEKLEKNKNIKQILITSNTLSSSKILSNLKLKKTKHQFFPIDTNNYTKKFLNYWKPSVAIFIDSEIWPNMISNIKSKKIPLLLLNGRITKKSFKKWMRFQKSAKKIFNQFDKCFPSSLQSKKYLKLLGAKKVKYLGNLKFSQMEKDEEHLNYSLKREILSKKIWCATSTHKNEEKLCGLVHQKLKRKHKKLLTIIIPRHIERTRTIINEMESLNLKVHAHSSKNKLHEDTDIYLVDSYGKTKSFFKICKTVFLGGSIIAHGGQNPLEAARYGCKILHGPNIWNFKEVYDLLNKHKVSSKTNNLNQIVDNVDKILKNKANYKSIKYKIDKIGKRILNSTIKEINFYVKKNES